mgnify:CR=1 FL=1
MEYDFGLPGEPLCNVPMSICSDPHGDLRRRDRERLEPTEPDEGGGEPDGGQCDRDDESASDALERPCGDQQQRR